MTLVRQFTVIQEQRFEVEPEDKNLSDEDLYRKYEDQISSIPIEEVEWIDYTHFFLE
jgi:hypothetical protein